MRTSVAATPAATPAASGKADAAWIERFDTPVSAPHPDHAPLAGLRFAAKDNIDVAGVPTTAACPSLPTCRTPTPR